VPATRGGRRSASAGVRLDCSRRPIVAAALTRPPRHIRGRSGRGP
jgi:hypothetical protein